MSLPVLNMTLLAGQTGHVDQEQPQTMDSGVMRTSLAELLLGEGNETSSLTLCPNNDTSAACLLTQQLFNMTTQSTPAIESTSLRSAGRTVGKTFPIDYVKIGVLSVIIFMTILGNLTVVLSILLRRAKVTRMFFFILHLSIADILTAFLTLFPEVVWTFTFPHFYGGKALCKTVKFVQAVGPYLSSYTLVMTAVDRYQVRKQKHPIKLQTCIYKKS